jgi:hypothetical protein
VRNGRDRLVAQGRRLACRAPLEARG